MERREGRKKGIGVNVLIGKRKEDVEVEEVKEGRVAAELPSRSRAARADRCMPRAAGSSPVASTRVCHAGSSSRHGTWPAAWLSSDNGDEPDEGREAGDGDTVIERRPPLRVSSSSAVDPLPHPRPTLGLAKLGELSRDPG